MKNTSILCLRCATIYPTALKEGVVLCPKCGWSIEAAEFHQLYAEATRVLMLGHMYREIYEEQFERDGEITSMYSLADPQPWYVFASLAALSGIIGNASYDVVKTVIKRLHAGRTDGNKQRDCSTASDNGIEVLVRHTKEFVGGMSVVNVVVRQCIEEEERADLVSKAHSEAASQLGKDADPEQAIVAIEQATRSAMQKIKAGETSCIERARMQRLLSDIWNELPDEQ